jgi:hypothetical protein
MNTPIVVASFVGKNHEHPIVVVMRPGNGASLVAKAVIAAKGELSWRDTVTFQNLYVLDQK